MIWRKTHSTSLRSAAGRCLTRATDSYLATGGVFRFGGKVVPGTSTRLETVQLIGIATFMTGGPFTVFDSSDNSLQGGAPEITGFSANPPELESGTRTRAHVRRRNGFNVSAFRQLAPDPLGRFQVFGDEGRNLVAGPGYVDWDFSAFKNIKVTESEELQFRAEFFNLLNHTNFRLPVSDIRSPHFGQIQADVSPRVI